MHDFCFPPGPSFSERHPLHQYPLTQFGFVGVHSSKKGGRGGEQNLTGVFYQVPGNLTVNRETGVGRLIERTC